jgi:hypothetical protein
MRPPSYPLTSASDCIILNLHQAVGATTTAGTPAQSPPTVRVRRVFYISPYDVKWRYSSEVCVMKDERKTKKQLIAELTEFRQRVAELEAADTERNGQRRRCGRLKPRKKPSWMPCPILSCFKTLICIFDGATRRQGDPWARLGRSWSAVTATNCGMVEASPANGVRYS